MKAMILAAGRGERMRPLTDYLPKPLLQIGNKPLIVYHIEALAKSNIFDIVINVCHLGDKIKEMLGDGSKWGVNIQYSVEEQLLNTGGAILKALPLLGNDPFLVVSADIWTDFPFADLPKRLDRLAHIILVDNPEYHPYGDFAVQGGLATLEGQLLNYGNIGVYCADFFKNCDTTTFALGPLLNNMIEKQLVTASYYSGIWFNVGTMEELSQVNAFYFQKARMIG